MLLSYVQILMGDVHHEAMILTRTPNSVHTGAYQGRAGCHYEKLHRFGEAPKSLWRWWAWVTLKTGVAWMRKAISPDLHRAKAGVELNMMTTSDVCLGPVNCCTQLMTSRCSFWLFAHHVLSRQDEEDVV